MKRPPRNGSETADYDSWREPTETMTVNTSERETFTGLYDHTGRPLHREPEPFGFNPHRWRKT